jgi:hypothetical protein
MRHETQIRRAALEAEKAAMHQAQTFQTSKIGRNVGGHHLK